MLGHALSSLLPAALCPSRAELNLLDSSAVTQYFSELDIGPGDTVIHLAARVGGVKANTEYVYSFYNDNSVINNNIISACIKNKVTKLICCLSTCIYPDAAHVTYPLTEEQLHSGPPHPSNFGYAYAKRMVDVQLRAARSQFGLNYISVIPNNLYGEHDNFDLEDGHVLPALMRKIWEAKLENKPSFEVWGDGQVFREFTYAEDIARAILFCAEKYDGVSPINIGDTNEYLLKDVIMLLKNELEYGGEISFDSTKPKGQLRKPSSNQKLINLGWDVNSYTSLEVGLKKTCEWFKGNYPHVRGVR